MKILITGLAGFLGRNVAALFFERGWDVVGCGRGSISSSEHARLGVSEWREGSISEELLQEIWNDPDVVIHCAGSGSVSQSLEAPYSDFCDTTLGTAVVLDFLRRKNSKAVFIYPSSPAVNGLCLKQPISITDPVKPISPYGYHKLSAELLCESYRRNFNLNTFVVRLFSVYGQGLKKQILWDACEKISNGDGGFWGTGLETRDFIHVRDVVELFYSIGINSRSDSPRILNCGSGLAYEVNHVVSEIKYYIGSGVQINFNGQVRAGDPIHYRADNQESLAFGWLPKISLADGLKEYVSWYQGIVR